MDATTLLSCAGELSALLVSGGLLLAASVAAKQSRKRSREDDEHEPPAAREDGELSDGEEDSISVEWRQLRKLLKTNLQIDLVHRPDAGADDKYVRLNFATKLPAKPSADDENRLIKALSNAGIKVLGSEGTSPPRRLWGASHRCAAQTPAFCASRRAMSASCPARRCCGA